MLGEIVRHEQAIFKYLREQGLGAVELTYEDVVSDIQGTVDLFRNVTRVGGVALDVSDDNPIKKDRDIRQPGARGAVPSSRAWAW